MATLTVKAKALMVSHARVTVKAMVLRPTRRGLQATIRARVRVRVLTPLLSPQARHVHQ
jgi:hypothetical protein